ncbi:MAG: RluA family pseudouridine synthase [Pseudoflavonifractor sp.]|nr:RluA family pseudouridine synthase [Alloprevotella sp.]MCM1116252.1 RluA family pseudouridine synthase [Pseudoflavonifractor sp.]
MTERPFHPSYIFAPEEEAVPIASDESQHKPVKPDVIRRWTVTDDDPTSLLEFISAKLPEMKRTRLKQMLRHDQVALLGVPVTDAMAKLDAGDEVAVNFTREFRLFRHRRLNIVYEDDDIIVVEKGYGLLSMGNENFKPGTDSFGAPRETAYSILRDYLKWKDPTQKVFIVHRLDRDTSGLMLFAKNVEAKETLQHNWNNMVLERKYVCVVEGCPDPESGTYTSYLKENSKHEVYSLAEPAPGAKRAVTRYKTLRRGRGYSLLEVELDTGRKNQIRVHMRELGTPIAGDRRYGGSSCGAKRLCLHAESLRFVHPTTRKLMSFSTPIPAAFNRVVG